jgi:acyl-CoA synthetase (AMP-forming)/AMP-acid ligase II
MPVWKDMWTGKTIGMALAEAAKRFGSREAMIFESGTVTYRQLHEISGKVARGLLALGISKGDRVAIWMAGYIEWSYIYYAIARIGAVMVPVNTRYKTFEVEHVLNKSKAHMLIFNDEKTRRKNYIGILNELIPELESATPDKLIAERLPHLRHVILISETRFPGCTSFATLLQKGEGVSLDTLARAEAEVNSEDPVLIQFTSGTMALPKGALLYQNAMLRGAYYNNYFLGVAEGARFFSPQPFYHVGGSIQVMLGPVVSGCIVILQTYFEPGGALRLMEQHRCTITMGHQPHWIEYLNHPDLKKRRLCLERADIFASPDIRKRVHEEMGISFLNSPYGMTETHLGGCSCRFEDPKEKWLNTVGKPMPGIELGVRDPETDEWLPSGRIGEACFRGWCVMRGYYDDPERTAEVLGVDGWFRTGDLGTIDNDGYFWLEGRIKDVIRVGGENVAALDVESFLMQHAKVKQAMVVGAPEVRLGEVCVAFVELKPGVGATEDEILSHCRAGLAGFKVPRKVVFVKEWPMSGTGKIQKFLLKERIGHITEEEGKK